LRTLPIIIASILLTACGGKTPKPIVVGAKSTTEQAILAEIIGQHLENRLQTKIERRINLGGTLIAYQLLQGGEITLYPENPADIESVILKEQAAPDPTLLFERAKAEMRRVGQLELMDPLGFDGGFVGVIRADDPRAAKVKTLSDAADVKDGWLVGVGYEFQQRSDGLPNLLQYHLPTKAAIRGMEEDRVFPALQEKNLTLIAASATAGLLTSADLKLIEDDKKHFLPQRASILVRQDMLKEYPKLGPALAELSGKFTTEKMRALNAQVELERKGVQDVAAAFLTQAGLR
jgi:osmoprotectant transport system substrate-binding protein